MVCDRENHLNLNTRLRICLRKGRRAAQRESRDQYSNWHKTTFK
jgi:hypothetical protein